MTITVPLVWGGLKEEQKNSYVRVDVGGVPLKIPRNYLDVPVKDRSRVDSLLLALMLPEFNPRTEDNRGDFFKTVSELKKNYGYDPIARILINEYNGNYYDMYEFSRNSNKPFEVEYLEGNYFHIRPLPVNGSFNFKQRDLFVELDNKGSPKVMVSCDIVGEVPYPGCYARFVHVNLLLKVSFRRDDWQGEWKSIVEKSKGLLASFKQ